MCGVPELLGLADGRLPGRPAATEGLQPEIQGARRGRLQGLVNLPGVERELDPEALSHYLSLRFVPGPGSIIKTIERLPAAHLFVYEPGGAELTTRRYWRPPFGASPPLDERELVPLLREQLLGAVSRWTLSDVPIACSLSGGIDSTLVAVISLSIVTAYTVPGWSGTS